ncbi:MAG: hypothetical protein WAM90_12025 [Rhodanobacter sp.]
MSSLWTDMLFLHGYISDLKLARRLVNMPVQPPPLEAESRQRSFSLRALLSPRLGRLCLGIGDGNVRKQ